MVGCVFEKYEQSHCPHLCHRGSFQESSNGLGFPNSDNLGISII